MVRDRAPIPHQTTWLYPRGLCNNCPRYARQWWQDTVDLQNVPQQAALALSFAV